MTEEEEDEEPLEDEFHGDDVVSLDESDDLRSKDRTGQGREGRGSGADLLTCGPSKHPPPSTSLMHRFTHTQHSLLMIVAPADKLYRELNSNWLHSELAQVTSQMVALSRRLINTHTQVTELTTAHHCIGHLCRAGGRAGSTNLALPHTLLHQHPLPSRLSVVQLTTLSDQQLRYSRFQATFTHCCIINQ